MMEERYHTTTQNWLYADMSNVNKKYYSEGKTYQPTYILTKIWENALVRRGHVC